MRGHSAIYDTNVSGLAGLVSKCVIKTHHSVNTSYAQWWVCNMIKLGKGEFGNNTESEPKPDFSDRMIAFTQFERSLYPSPL